MPLLPDEIWTHIYYELLALDLLATRSAAAQQRRPRRTLRGSGQGAHRLPTLDAALHPQRAPHADAC
eukprot:2826722-Prymnesium_polylepis.1